jgi:hypothetical protein
VRSDTRARVWRGCGARTCHVFLGLLLCRTRREASVAQASQLARTRSAAVGKKVQNEVRAERCMGNQSSTIF